MALFWPFLERRIDHLLAGENVAPPTVLPTALVDEPDLHLHPTLQVSLVHYLRELSRRGEAQFIITTHSPTILDAVSEEELYLLAPVASAGDRNQFVRVSTSHERLETIRGVTGSTHLVTRCRPIVYLEGEAPTGRQASDQRLVELLIPEAAAWVTVPARGRIEAIRSAQLLRDAVAENLPGIAVFALIDRDQVRGDDPDWAISWPVAMIENLLLDSEAIWTFLAPYREHVAPRSPAEVSAALQDIAIERRQEDIRLRVLSRIRPFRIELDVTDDLVGEELLQKAHEDLERQFESIGGGDHVLSLVEDAQRECNPY